MHEDYTNPPTPPADLPIPGLGNGFPKSYAERPKVVAKLNTRTRNGQRVLVGYVHQSIATGTRLILYRFVGTQYVLAETE